MAESAVDELETAIADLGNILVALEKFRMQPDHLTDLRRAAVELGDHVRRLHRRGRLDAERASALLRDAEAMAVDLRGELDAHRASPLYRDAVAAHRGADAAALRRLLPELFAGLAPLDPPPALHHPLPWFRRGRALDPREIARAAAALRREGLAGDGDATARGCDPELPAVVLDEEPDPATPATLRWTATDLPPVVFRLVDTGDVLVHVPRLTAPAAVLVPNALEGDDLADLLPDYEPYRAALCQALRDAGLEPVTGG